jgi:peptidyl-prolyl cis-trans isomerase SurA
MKNFKFILPILISLTPLPIVAEVLDYIVAVVNEDVITHTALQQKIQETVAGLRKREVNIPPQHELEKQILENMIRRTLQLQLAKQTGIEVDDNSLNEMLRNVAAQEQKTLQDFRLTVERDGYEFREFREELRNEMLIKRLQQRQVVNHINVTNREIEAFLKNQTQQGEKSEEYQLLHILIALPEAASPEIIESKRRESEKVLARLQAGADFKEVAFTASDSQLALEGGDLGWRKIGEVPTLFVDRIKKMAVGAIEGPIRNASGFHIIKLADKRYAEEVMVTQTKVRHILRKTSELISDFEAEQGLSTLKTRVEDGDDFAVLAQAHSDDQGSASEGGLLGWINPGDLVPEFEEVMAKLRIGEVSKPFKSRYGWHIIQVLERRQQDNTKSAQRNKAMRQIRQRKVEEELQAWLRQMRDEAYVEYRSVGQ